MSQRYIGSSISPTAAPTTSTSTTGVWSINDQYQAKNAGNWPMYTPPATTDPYFPYVSMLLPGNGTNGAQNNTFLDSSSNATTITRNGNTTQGTFSPYYDGWSNYFDGNGDYLSISNNGGVIPSTSTTFTIEAWVYSTALQAEFATPRAPCMFGDINGVTNYMSFGPVNYSGTQYVGLYWVGGSSAGCYGTTTPLALNTWYHIAISVSANSIKLFVNGALQTLSGTTTLTNRGGTSGAYSIGNYNSNTCAFTGYISNLRVVNGTALYSSTFTPSTTPLTSVSGTTYLTCQSNRFIDNSANNFAITKNGDTSVQKFSPFSPSAPYSADTNGGSAYFDGSGDYLTVPSNAAFGFGTGDFTIEFWTYPTVNARQDWIDFDGGGTRLLIYYSGSAITYYASGGARITGSAMVLNSWQHIALVRSSGTSKLYVNGIQVGSSYSDTINFAAQPLTIAKDNAGSTYVTGYMSNIRIVKGTAVYTSNFVPPTAPVTAITNTSLLVNGTNAGIIDNAEINVLETVNQVQISTTESKFGGSSIYFDGSGDYLKIPTNQVFAFGTGDFTVELWVYVINLSSIRQFYESYAGDSSGRLLMVVETNGNVKVQGSGGSVKTAGGTVPTNTWTHIAVTKASGSMRIFVNGTQVNTTYSDSSTYTCTEPVKLGINGYDTSSYPFYGYMDDYRITKGYARYTTNFTAPTAAFPTS